MPTDCRSENGCACIAGWMELEHPGRERHLDGEHSGLRYPCMVNDDGNERSLAGQTAEWFSIDVS
jgi:hypothetical protein